MSVDFEVIFTVLQWINEFPTAPIHSLGTVGGSPVGSVYSVPRLRATDLAKVLSREERKLVR